MKIQSLWKWWWSHPTHPWCARAPTRKTSIPVAAAGVPHGLSPHRNPQAGAASLGFCDPIGAWGWKLANFDFAVSPTPPVLNSRQVAGCPHCNKLIALPSRSRSAFVRSHNASRPRCNIFRAEPRGALRSGIFYLSVDLLAVRWLAIQFVSNDTFLNPSVTVCYGEEGSLGLFGLRRWKA